ncbi:hypothetical protein [Pseudomonas asiatica]|jgi:hypothetical protein|uniref:hypothetical protein n=1 Tax=Pseudomonas asiatica TaxID=2219225 RepID=UPI0010C04B2F|nr:hypothetical protein [Pseudomonas asiatica]
MSNRDDDGDFRARKKRVLISGADAQAFIEARRKEREEFRQAEGKDLDGLDQLARDPAMDELQKKHQEQQEAREETDTEKSYLTTKRQEQLPQEQQDQQQRSM